MKLSLGDAVEPVKYLLMFCCNAYAVIFYRYHKIGTADGRIDLYHGSGRILNSVFDQLIKQSLRYDLSAFTRIWGMENLV